MGSMLVLLYGFYFNSRTHVECDLLVLLMQFSFSSISTHALTWSATGCGGADSSTAEFQLTHSRGVRHSGFYERFANWIISTHALTWSATWVAC